MTFEDCHSVLAALRKIQNTRNPLVRVDYGGNVIKGRVARSDSDIVGRRKGDTPYGLLVLEPPGLGDKPETILQIADIPDDGLRPLNG